jgi:hypothetical protein
MSKKSSFSSSFTKNTKFFYLSHNAHDGIVVPGFVVCGSLNVDLFLLGDGVENGQEHTMEELLLHVSQHLQNNNTLTLKAIIQIDVMAIH